MDRRGVHYPHPDPEHPALIACRERRTAAPLGAAVLLFFPGGPGQILQGLQGLVRLLQRVVKVGQDIPGGIPHFRPGTLPAKPLDPFSCSFLPGSLLLLPKYAFRRFWGLWIWYHTGMAHAAEPPLQKEGIFQPLFNPATAPCPGRRTGTLPGAPLPGSGTAPLP